MNAIPDAAAVTGALDRFAQLSRWVGWRNRRRGDDVTKVPFSPSTGAEAKADDPATWTTQAHAQAWARRSVNGEGGGIGIELGDLGDGTALGGVDLDTCRDEQGTFTPWAQDAMRDLASYTEVSPSGSGAKVFFLYDATALPDLRRAMGTQHGKSWKQGTGKHAPGIEMHVSNRYFTVTGQALDSTPSDVRHVSTETLLNLIRVTGPAVTGAAKRPAGRPHRPSAGGALLAQRIEAAAATSAILARRWAGDWTGLQDASASGRAMALGAAVKRAGFGFDDMAAALRLHHDTAEWARTKGDAAGGRELRRLFDAAGVVAAEATDPEMLMHPDMTVLRLNRRPPPVLPLAVVGDSWAGWIAAVAEGAACPADYVFGPLLAAASALIGNARWAQATPSWAEPPHIWCASIGDSGTGKSPGGDVLMRHVLPEIERRMIGDFPDRHRDFKAQKEAREAAMECWKAEVRAAQKKSTPPPLPPSDDPPAEPQTPRLRQSDVTIEKVATLLAQAAPKGLLLTRDELAGWLLGMTTYNESGRAFWIEAYGGRPYRVERQKHPEPIEVPHMTVAVTGGTQPERLAQLMRDADDGLLARFCWFWPDSQPFRLARITPGADWATTALDRLRLLEMQPGAAGEPARPIMVPLTEAALQHLEAFARDMQDRQQHAAGLMRSALGKARGLALRLSLVLELLHWCARDGYGPPPSTISEAAFVAAAHLVADYIVPMAERTYGDAACPEADRNAATLARWITRDHPAEVYVRHLLREVRLPGLMEADKIKAAASVLVEAGWLLPTSIGFGAASKVAYPVNPRVFEVAT